jgi:hypothetical protein
MGKDVLKWAGLLLGFVGIAAFFYGLTVLISNGSCGCGEDGFCGPACPPADNLGFIGLFAGIWVAIGGFILAGIARARARVQHWRAQLPAGSGPYQGSRLGMPAGSPDTGGLTFASMGGSFGGGGAPPTLADFSELAAEISRVRHENASNPEAARQATLDLLRRRGLPIPANVPPGSVLQLGNPGSTQLGGAGAAEAGGPGFALPGSLPGTQPPAPMSAEQILARDAPTGLPSMPPVPGDAAGRLQELDALKQQGVLTDDEYAAQRKRILDSI